MENIYAVNIDKNGKINKSKDIQEGPCIFPFKYKRKAIDKCLESERGKWCATEIKDSGAYSKYAYCPETQKQNERYSNIIGDKINKISKKKSSNSSKKMSKKKSSSLSSVSSFHGEKTSPLEDYWKNLEHRENYTWEQDYIYNMLPKDKREKIDKLSFDKQILYLEKAASKNSKYRPPSRPPSPDQPPPMYVYKSNQSSMSSNSLLDSESKVIIKKKNKKIPEIKKYGIVDYKNPKNTLQTPVWVSGAPNTMLYIGKHLGNNCSGHIVNLKDARKIAENFYPERFDKYHQDFRIVKFNNDDIEKLPFERKDKMHKIGNIDWVHVSQIYIMDNNKDGTFDPPFLVELLNQKILVKADTVGNGDKKDFKDAEIFINGDYLGETKYWDKYSENNYVFLRFIGEDDYYKFPCRQIINEIDLKGLCYSDNNSVIQIGDKVRIVKDKTNINKLATVIKIDSDNCSVIYKDNYSPDSVSFENVKKSILEIISKKPKLLPLNNVILLDSKYYLEKGYLIEIRNNFIPGKPESFEKGKIWCLIEIDHQSGEGKSIWIDSQYVIQPDIFDIDDYKGTIPYQLSEGKSSEIEIYEDNFIDKLLVPTKILDDDKDYASVTFHVEKEMRDPGVYIMHLYLINNSGEITDYHKQKVIKYGESRISFEAWTSFVSPLIEFVLGVGDGGYIQFLPFKISNRLPSSIQEVESVSKSLPVSNSRWLEMMISNSSKDFKDYSSKDLRSPFLRFKVNDQIINKKSYNNTLTSISSINFDSKITIDTKKEKNIDIGDFTCQVNSPVIGSLTRNLSLINNDIVGVVDNTTDNTYSFIGQIDNNSLQGNPNFVNLKNIVSFKDIKTLKNNKKIESKLRKKNRGEKKSAHIQNCFHLFDEDINLYLLLRSFFILPEWGLASDYSDKVFPGDIVFIPFDDKDRKFKVLYKYDDYITIYDTKAHDISYNIEHIEYYLQRDPNSEPHEFLVSTHEYTTPKKDDSNSSDKKNYRLTPQSPDYYPTYITNSPPYNPNSPPYIPNSLPYNPNSPPYIPTSPPYNPTSPPYNTNDNSHVSPLKSTSPNISTKYKLSSPYVKKDGKIYVPLSVYYDNEIYAGDPFLSGWLFKSGSGYDVEDDRYESIVRDSQNNPTEKWFIYDNEDYPEVKYPDRTPKGWNKKDLFYDNGDPIFNLTMVAELMKNKVANNWEISLKKVKDMGVHVLPSPPKRPKKKYSSFPSPEPYKKYYTPLEIGQLVMVDSSEYKIISKKSHSDKTLKDIKENSDPHIQESSSSKQHKTFEEISILDQSTGTVLKDDTENSGYVYIDIDFYPEEINIDDYLEYNEEFKQGYVKVRRQYTKEIQTMSIKEYWKNKIGIMNDRNIKIFGAENRFFNTIYKISNEFDPDEKIILDKFGNPVFEDERLKPVYTASERPAFIKKEIDIDGKSYWTISSESNSYGKKMIKTFYFSYSYDNNSIHPPYRGWYSGKGERKGKDIKFNPMDEKFVLNDFEYSSLRMNTTNLLPLNNKTDDKQGCRNCGGDHTIQDCTKPPEKHMGSCKFCGEFGHWERDCSKNTTKKTKKTHDSDSLSIQSHKKTQKIKSFDSFSSEDENSSSSSKKSLIKEYSVGKSKKTENKKSNKGTKKLSASALSLFTKKKK
jgi:hypothetical protein